MSRTFHQDSAVQWNKLWMWKISNLVMPNSLGKRHHNSVWTKYVCDKSEDVRVCAKWQWNALDRCYWIALPASPGMQSSNTVSCVSLSFRTHPCVFAIVHTFWLSQLGFITLRRPIEGCNKHQPRPKYSPSKELHYSDIISPDGSFNMFLKLTTSHHSPYDRPPMWDGTKGDQWTLLIKEK